MNGTSLNKGFTLIELIMVIVLLGVLAAVAIPKFIDLRQDAQQAALDGFAGALNAANSINYSGCSVNNNVPLAGKCVAVSKCSDLNSAALMVTPLSLGAAGASITNVYNLLTDTANAVNGKNTTCTLQYKYSGTTLTRTFTATSAGN